MKRNGPGGVGHLSNKMALSEGRIKSSPVLETPSSRRVITTGLQTRNVLCTTCKLVNGRCFLVIHISTRDAIIKSEPLQSVCELHESRNVSH